MSADRVVAEMRIGDELCPLLVQRDLLRGRVDHC